MKTQILTLALLSTALSAAIPAQRRQAPSPADVAEAVAASPDVVHQTHQDGLIDDVLDIVLGHNSVASPETISDDDTVDGLLGSPIKARDDGDDDEVDHKGLFGKTTDGVGNFVFGEDDDDNDDEEIDDGILGSLGARDVVGDDHSDFEAASHGGIVGGVVDGIGNGLFGQDNQDNTHHFVHDVPEAVAKPVAVTPAVAPVAVTPAVAPVAARPVAAAPVAAAPAIAAAPLNAPVGASNIVPAAVNTVANAAGAVPAAL